MSDLEDALERARVGDANGMAELYRAYAAPLLAYLVTQVRRREDAEDLLGEVFLSAMRDVSRFDGNIGGFRAWLYRIASNRAVDLARRNARRPEDPLAVAFEQPGEADPAGEALGRVDRERWLGGAPPIARDFTIAGSLSMARLALGSTAFRSPS